MRTRKAIYNLAGALYYCDPENLDILDCLVPYALLLPARAQKRVREGSTKDRDIACADFYIQKLNTFQSKDIEPLNADQICGFIKLRLIHLRRIKRVDQEYLNSIENTRNHLRKYIFWIYLQEDILDELPQKYEKEYNSRASNVENITELAKECNFIWCAINRYILQEVDSKMQEFLRKTQSMKSRYSDMINTIKIAIGNFDNISKCSVCMDKIPTMAFSRCGHLCICVTCSYCLDKCPICRSSGNAIRIYTP